MESQNMHSDLPPSYASLGIKEGEFEVAAWEKATYQPSIDSIDTATFHRGFTLYAEFFTCSRLPPPPSGPPPPHCIVSGDDSEKQKPLRNHIPLERRKAIKRKNPPPLKQYSPEFTALVLELDPESLSDDDVTLIEQEIMFDYTRHSFDKISKGGKRGSMMLDDFIKLVKGGMSHCCSSAM
ncbi:UNVERIFIED_CONTAM: hypothetical protein HDU68_003266 [Siphonaria sp. JEL0065]|nr:hypothetical protein HDU68_003266 [Siphonaria sp. JEL0065]